jgi:DNA-binding YbaB/EbfC family protein
MVRGDPRLGQEWKGMLKELANLGNLMRHAQEMGSRMQQVNEQLKARRVVGEAGGGMVQVEMNGLGQVVRLTIEPALVERNEREMIEDLVPAATNDASQKAKQLHAEAMQTLTQGMNLPGLDAALSKLTGTEPS